VLADGLSLAAESKPDAIVDIATLTGAASIALGRSIAPVMVNNGNLLDQVRSAGDRAGERLWELPLPDDYRKHMDSEVADIKNIGRPAQAGTIIGGLFLREFVDGIPWAHLDVAATARTDEDEGYTRKGATGFGVRTLIELVSEFKKP
jgi:leucyl aminopeptidase